MCIDLTEIRNGCTPRAGGVLSVHGALKRDIESIPAFTTGTHTVPSNIVMKEDKYFVPIEFKQDGGQLDTPQQGSGNQQLKFITNLTLQILGSEPAKRYLLTSLANDEWVFIVEKNDGSAPVLLGNMKRGATMIEYNDNAGMAFADDNMITVKWKFDSNTGPVTYLGTLPLEPEEIES
jgi:hypothetical protein